MEKNLSALGFMSGTSGDGVDSSVISSNGKDSIIIKYKELHHGTILIFGFACGYLFRSILN